MITKTKALIATIGVMLGGITLVYALVTYTKLVILSMMAVIGMLGAKVIYTEILNYLLDQEKIKTGKWSNKK